MQDAKTNYEVLMLAVGQQNGTLKRGALTALKKVGIDVTDQAALTRRQIPVRAHGYFSAMLDGLVSGDRQAVKRSTDQLRACGLTVRVDQSVIDRGRLASLTNPA